MCVAGRSETEVTYNVGFDDDGCISTLDVKGWCLAGASMDLANNDMLGIKMGLDGVR